MKTNIETIITDEENELETDKFMSFGNDLKYIAIVNGDLYCRTDGKTYHLIKEDYLKKNR